VAAVAVPGQVTGGPIGPAPGGASCPDRGVMRVGPKSEGSDQGTTCSGGISFTFGGQVYTAESSRCPNSVTYTPPHDVLDPSTEKKCTWWGPTGTTYNSTKTNYQCYWYFPLFGCGTIGFGHCCEASGPPEIVNTFPNYAEDRCVPCKSVADATDDEEPEEDPVGDPDANN
jgi:hypothetical protein